MSEAKKIDPTKLIHIIKQDCSAEERYHNVAFLRESVSKGIEHAGQLGLITMVVKLQDLDNTLEFLEESERSRF